MKFFLKIQNPSTSILSKHDHHMWGGGGQLVKRLGVLKILFSKTKWSRLSNV